MRCSAACRARKSIFCVHIANEVTAIESPRLHKVDDPKSSGIFSRNLLARSDMLSSANIHSIIVKVSSPFCCQRYYVLPNSELPGRMELRLHIDAGANFETDEEMAWPTFWNT
jgi:hypothetical protein